MADAGTDRLRLDEQGVRIAIGRDRLHHQAVAGAFALDPQLLARAAEERDVPRSKSFVEGLLVHVAHHQNALCLVILDDRGDQSVLFIEVELETHRNPSVNEK